MSDSVRDFLSKSPLAHRIKLPTRIMVQRTQVSSGRLVQIKKDGSYGPVPKEEEICELEVGGQVIARGKIVRRKGEFFFKVRERLEEVRP
jgi:hypothetical protein